MTDKDWQARALEVFARTHHELATSAAQMILTFAREYAAEVEERERMRLAGVSTAAQGYWKESDSIHPDYDTVAIRDVAKLYVSYTEALAEVERLRDGIENFRLGLMDAARINADLRAEVEHLGYELARTRAQFERCVQILTGIHALLYPPMVTNAKGITFQFHSPHVHEQMQALSDKIRAIPDTIADLRAQLAAAGPVKVPNILHALRNAQFAANGTHAEPGYISLLRRLSAYDMDLIRNALNAAPPKETG